MRLVLAYDSTYGNTARVAEAIADGWPREARDPPAPLRDLEVRRLDRGVLFVVGAPTHRHGVDPATWRVLERIPTERLRDLPVAAFDTRYDQTRWLTGSAAHEIERALVARGARAVVPPESFFVAGREGPLENGELERARAWGVALYRAHAPRAEPPVLAARRF